MTDRPLLADRWGHRAGLTAAAGVTAVVIGAGVAAAASPASTSASSGWMLAAGGFLAGALLATVVCLTWYRRSLSRAAAACEGLGNLDLSRTIPETGPRDLRVLASRINALLADFQEVLLLIAYQVRSATASMHVLQQRAGAGECDHALRGLVAAVLSDLRQMQNITEGFKYFRVRIENGTIVDAGLCTSPARSHAAEPVAARREDAPPCCHGRGEEGSRHE